MPSFFPRMPRHQLPPTPPDYTQQFSSNANVHGCGGVQFQPNSYAAQAGFGYQDDATHDFTDPYGSRSIPAAPPSSTMYQQPSAYSSSAVIIPPVNRYYEPAGAPILPPMRTYDQNTFHGNEMQSQRPLDLPTKQEHTQPKEEKPVGGVSAKLDYDMEVMTDFVSEMAQGIIQAGQTVPPVFRKWVHSVLCATRLPSATILLSLHYLSSRMTMLSTGGQFRAAEGQIYRLLTTALILGSKFLDDNTFINRSWSEVSGIEVAVLNHLETEWLVAIEFTLHRDPSGPQGFDSWQKHWTDYEAQALARSARTMKLSPLDTTVQRQQAAHKQYVPPISQTGYAKVHTHDYSAASQPPQYSASAYAQFDPWLVPRSATDSSPASAPHTGPTTPEYYGGPGTWAPPEGYPRRTMFGFPRLSTNLPQSQPQVHSATYGHTPFTPQYNYHNFVGHALGCGCVYCTARQQPPYYMAPGYGQLSVAG